MDMHRYTTLSRAQLSYGYLHTNSTTHEFLFGALAELVDNARDASATKLNIYTVKDASVRGGYLLCFLDDGEGMDPHEAADIITFGRSSKKSLDSQLIGMYGNGLKSGSMRIGNDLMVFTKKGAQMSCILLSRTFHELEDIDEIIVPMPTFDSQTKKPMAKTHKEKEKHALEMELILKYSPFKTEAAFMREFDHMDSTSGTLIIIYNMKLLDSGEPELDHKSNSFDILLSNPEGRDFDTDEGLMPERRSFRAYASILYVDPRMRIYIQGKKVRTKRLANCLYKPRIYKYSSSRFKTRSESEARKSQDEARNAENKAREAESKVRNLEHKYSGGTNKEQRAELRRMQQLAVEFRKDVQLKKQVSERKVKSLREPKTLNFIFGVNINNRNQDGMFVYNCSRLIKMYQKVGPQADGGVFCSGVVGVVDVPYLVLEPTHNKQDFADAKEYRHLQKAMGEHMVQYWKDLGIAQQGVTRFWETFGYISPNWRDAPSVDAKYIRKRAMQVQVSLQCDLCLKWRILPFSSNNIGKMFPDDWVCSMNPDSLHNRCSSTEQKTNFPDGLLKKEVKTHEQKEKDLEQEIRKKQEQLEKIQKTKVVTSTRQLREMEEDEEEEEEEEEEELRPKPRGKRSSASSAKPASRRSSSRWKEESEDEEEEEEQEEEEEEEEPPVKKGCQKMSKQQARPSRSNGIAPARVSTVSSSRKTAAATPSRSSSSREDVSTVTNKRGRPSLRQGRIRESPMLIESDSEVDGVSMDATEPDDGSPEHSDLGSKVEVKSENKWHSAVIVEVNKKQLKWRVKFDKHPQDKHDKWVEVNSPNVKLTKDVQTPVAESTVAVPYSPASISSHETTNETPSSSTAPSSSTVPSAATAALPGNVNIEDIANGYRTCLRYFLPPKWIMDKDTVSTLTIQELSTFPLDEFFDHYEKGLRKLVSSFQIEAMARQQEGQQAKNKLSSVRKMIAKLLKSINEEFDIDPNSDSDQVDELLALCVKQATQQAPEGAEQSAT